MGESQSEVAVKRIEELSNRVEALRELCERKLGAVMVDLPPSPPVNVAADPRDLPPLFMSLHHVMDGMSVSITQLEECIERVVL